MSDSLFEPTLIGSVTPEDNSLTSPDALRPGEMLEKFEIIRELGRGGMGAVYLARDPTLDRKVAIKVLSPDFSRDESSLKRFLAEARAAGQLSHPNVVGVYEVGHRETGDYFIAMEYLPKGAVADHLKDRTPCDSVWATKVILDAARGLAAAHHVGLIHRDVKPANLMIDETGVTKVGDFGLVRSQNLEDAKMTQAGQIMGTPYYMSPEQCVGREVDGRTDIYSLGATYYALLAGSSPFAGNNSTMEIIVAHVNHAAPNLATMNPKVPAACARIVERALEKAPEHRYQTAEEMIVDLEAMLSILRDDTARTTVTYRGTKSNKLELFVLPSESSRPSGSPTKSSLLTRFINRAAGDSSSISKSAVQTHGRLESASSSSSTNATAATDSSALQQDSEVEATEAMQVRRNYSVTPPNHAEIREDVFSLKAGSVVLAWPAKMTNDDVTAVQDWLKLVGEKMQRTAAENASEAEQKSVNP